MTIKPFTEWSIGSIVAWVFGGIIAVFAVISWERPQTRRIADVSGPHTLEFHPTGIFDPSGYVLRIKGSIEGAASIAVPDNTHPTTISGNVDSFISHDFGESSLVVEYQPAHVRSGNLTFRLTFQ